MSRHYHNCNLNVSIQPIYIYSQRRTRIRNMRSTKSSLVVSQIMLHSNFLRQRLQTDLHPFTTDDDNNNNRPQTTVQHKTMVVGQHIMAKKTTRIAASKSSATTCRCCLCPSIVLSLRASKQKSRMETIEQRHQTGIKATTHRSTSCNTVCKQSRGDDSTHCKGEQYQGENSTTSTTNRCNHYDSKNYTWLQSTNANETPFNHIQCVGHSTRHSCMACTRYCGMETSIAPKYSGIEAGSSKATSQQTNKTIDGKTFFTNTAK